MNQSYSVHASLPSMTVWVQAKVFYNMREVDIPPIKCKLFGLTCMEGRVPTFEVVTADGYVFSEIPPHLIFWKNPEQVKEQFSYELKDLVYNNCLSIDFSLTSFDELVNRNAFVFFKSKGEYESAKYWFSLDFYKDNNWYHCMLLDNGQIAFIPSHKIIFSNSLPDVHKFPDFEKLRVTFQV